VLQRLGHRPERPGRAAVCLFAGGADIFRVSADIFRVSADIFRVSADVYPQRIGWNLQRPRLRRCTEQRQQQQAAIPPAMRNHDNSNTNELGKRSAPQSFIILNARIPAALRGISNRPSFAWNTSPVTRSTALLLPAGAEAVTEFRFTFTT